MLGYLKCEEGELLVKHHRLYSAVYCGLCRTAKKEGLSSMLPFFSYDFVFLAILRMLVTGEKMELEKNVCLFHPFRQKKTRLSPNETLSYVSYAALLLTAEKMRDDLYDGDVSFSKRLAFRLCLPKMDRQRKRYEKKKGIGAALSSKVAECLEEGRNLEKKGALLDPMCECFARPLSELFSFGTEGEGERILRGIGDRLGRFLYTLDALDDRERDLKNNAFNPILKDGILPDQDALCQIDMVLSFYIDEMKKILDLIEGDQALFALCENILCKALPGAVKKSIKLGEQDERSL